MDLIGRKAARVTLMVQVKLVKTVDERCKGEAETLRRRKAFQKRGANTVKISSKLMVQTSDRAQGA